MGITTSQADRDIGVVYLDSARAAAPSTHALVIGVGQYASNKLEPVSSPPLAARAIAEWFLDGTLDRKTDSFNNPVKPLGSLGVLLSEHPGGALSRLEEADVPRATFGAVKKAVLAWSKRARAHSDNLLFLFVSSHGESFGRRTAFLLEDYGTDEDDVTAGMSEIEQFVEALANVDPEQQLLVFDCCRAPTSLGLRFDQQFGTKLINPAASGLSIRRPHVLRSTGLGAEAYGVKNRPTLFTQALLDALKGLGASPNDGWSVDTYGLGRTAARLLGLHFRDGKQLQHPESQLSTPFVISVAQPADIATVFVSLGPKHDFSTSRIRVMDGEIIVDEVAGTDGPPFARLELPKYQRRTIAAFDSDGKVIGQTQIEALPPVAFRELPDSLNVIRSAGPRTMSGTGKGVIVLSVLSPDLSAPANVVASLSRRDDRATHPITVVLSANGPQQTVEVEAGWYVINLAMPDGQLRSIEAEVKSAAKVEVKLDLSIPPADRSRAREPDLEEYLSHESAGTLVVRGAYVDQTPPSDVTEWLQRLGASEERIVTAATAGDTIFVASVSPSIQRVLQRPNPGAMADIGNAPPLEIGMPPDAGTMFIFPIADSETRRLPDHLVPRPLIPADYPAWLAVVGPGFQEIVAFPSLGLAGKYLYDATGSKLEPWIPELRVDTRPSPVTSHATSIVHTRQWFGLLDFLALRDFERSAVVLNALLAEGRIRDALFQKVENPLAAIAGAAVAVATDRLEQARIPEQWLQNLSNWFPGLPDGPVIRARLLLSRERVEGRRSEAKTLLLAAYNRGIPVLSLVVDWLAQGLAAFGADPDTVDAAKNAHRIAQLSDPTRAFTVLRIPL